MKYFYGMLSAIWLGWIVFYSMLDFANNMWPIIICIAFVAVNLFYFTKALKPQNRNPTFVLNTIIIFAAFGSQTLCLYFIKGGKTYFGIADIVLFFFLGIVLTGVSYRVNKK